MKKMKLFQPGKILNTSQHCYCSWCQEVVDPTKVGVCKDCHGKLQKQLSSQKWVKQRLVYLATLETGYCHGFLVNCDFNTTPNTISISLSGIISPVDMAVEGITILRAQSLLSLHGIVPSSLLYFPCRSTRSTEAKRIDHILPWHYYPSLFWHTENHQALCLDCNGMKTQLDKSHRTDWRHSV